MTDAVPPEGDLPSPPAARDPWDLAAERLRSRHPDATTGTLFCVHKLEQDPDLTLKDFRDEANLRGISLSGRSFHSAKVLLGMSAPATRRPRRVVEEEPEVATPRPERPAARRPQPTARGTAGDSLESTLLAAVQQLQADATARSQRLREAMRQAISILEEALESED